ncbi:MAG: hypothetical protein J0H55_10615 [Chitinophagaceae bacterium]|nr:hypothetical protein [Chitinophagaceae bacterium]
MKIENCEGFFFGILLYPRYTWAVPSSAGDTEWYGQRAEKGRRNQGVKYFQDASVINAINSRKNYARKFHLLG